MWFSVFFAFLTVIASAELGLPHYSGPELSMESGYITIDPQTGKNLFYWLIRAQKNASTAPLAVWYQGGPGCSGLDGLLTEQGPFAMNEDGTLSYRDVSWTSVANMLFVEAPVGVGFSYSDTESDYSISDASAAQDNYVFLQKFMETYPEYADRDLWITGESYAGVYIPTLVDLITRDSSTSLYAQLAGFMAGNPVMDCDSLNHNDVDMNILYWHSLASYRNYHKWQTEKCADEKKTSRKCAKILEDTFNGVGSIVQQIDELEPSSVQPSLDPDDLYQDFCTGNGTLEFADYPLSDTCVSIGALSSAYLNRPEVQAALGVQKTEWNACTDKIRYRSSGESMIPYYRRIIANKPGIHVLVYSGDIDILTVPISYTLPCLFELDADLVRDWQPWFVNGATAGYFEEYETYTFATLKGAGHEAAQYQPLTTFEMFSRYMESQDLGGEEDATGAYESQIESVRQGDLVRVLRRRKRLMAAGAEIQ